MLKEFRFVGAHADETDSGRPLAPGEYTGPINERAPKNKQLIDDGLLLPVEDGTTEKVAAIEEAGRAKEGHLTEEEWLAAEASVSVKHKKKDGDN